MVPPTSTLNFDIAAISGICGSISIACWVVVFSPQIVENFRRGSADGLSLQFIIVWLAGDVFNILGAVLQGVLPTMIILAVYYTIADIVLLAQCFYYRGFTWHDEVVPPKLTTSSIGEAHERTGLLNHNQNPLLAHERRGSGVSATHLSPAMPLLDAPKSSDPSAIANAKPTTRLQATLFNLVAVLMVCAAGVLGWYVSNRSQSGSSHHRHHHHRNKTHSSHLSSTSEDEGISFSIWGQIFGYFCAILYLGSRIPQLLLNYRRKSTEGVSMLFFLFACIGNLTYVLSIFAYEPHCSGAKRGCERGEMGREYGRYIAVNASWLAGSLGTLFLDAGIFAQFFLYRVEDEHVESAVENGDAERRERLGSRDERPLLERGDSGYQ